MLSIACVRDAQARGGGAVDGQRGLQTLVLLVGVDVDQLGQRCAASGARCGAHSKSSLGIVALQGVLILGAAGAAADAEVLHRLQDRGVAPGMCAVLRRSRAITWSAVTFRSLLAASGSRTSRPGVAGRRRRRPSTFSTAGSSCTMSDELRHAASRMAWNEMSWSAWMRPFIRPVSCCGKKPLGMMT